MISGAGPRDPLICGSGSPPTSVTGPLTVAQ
jgi:hypothetical protein